MASALGSIAGSFKGQAPVDAWFDALEALDEERVQRFLDDGLSLHVRATRARHGAGYRALHVLARLPRSEAWDRVAQRLLRAGATLDVSTSNGMTPLHVAVQQGHLATVDALLCLGASPGATMGRWRDTPLTLALQQRRLDLAQRLLRAGATWGPPTRRDPLIDAVRALDAPTVRWVLAHRTPAFSWAGPDARSRSTADADPHPLLSSYSTWLEPWDHDRIERGRDVLTALFDAGLSALAPMGRGHIPLTYLGTLAPHLPLALLETVAQRTPWHDLWPRSAVPTWSENDPQPPWAGLFEWIGTLAARARVDTLQALAAWGLPLDLVHPVSGATVWHVVTDGRAWLHRSEAHAAEGRSLDLTRLFSLLPRTPGVLLQPDRGGETPLARLVEGWMRLSEPEHDRGFFRHVLSHLDLFAEITPENLAAVWHDALQEGCQRPNQRSPWTRLVSLLETSRPAQVMQDALPLILDCCQTPLFLASEVERTFLMRMALRRAAPASLADRAPPLSRRL